VVGAALFASNIGSEHLVGLAGTGFDSGVAVGQFEVLASLILLILGWVFVPFYIRSGVYTMPEFLERRYSPAARWYLAIISIVGYVLTKISVTLFAGGIVFEVLFGGGFWTGALIIVLATGVYTVAGGLRAVLYTETLQMVMLIGGAVLVTAVGLAKLGGWSAMRSLVDAGHFDMWKPMTDPSFPWTGILFGAPILGVWYWCTDQFIVQRVLSANGIDDARRGTIFGGFLKLLPLFIFVIPGVVAAALVSTGQLELARHRVRLGDGSPDPRAEQGLAERFSLLVRRYQFPPLCDPALCGVHGGAGRRQPGDPGRERGAIGRADLRHRRCAAPGRDRRRPATGFRLGLAAQRSLVVGGTRDLRRAGVALLPRVIRTTGDGICVQRRW
jgi:hypothetical protein